MPATPRVAFYAPLKHPDHPVPSGDRAMGRLLLRALATAGFEPDLASRLGSYNADGDASRQDAIEAAAEAETEQLMARFSALPSDERPALWFTYHNYYKAPDLIGPAVAAALSLPYVVAEGSRAPKRAEGPHARGHAAAEAALDRASLLLVLNPRDRPALEAVSMPGQRIVDLPPFLDMAEWPPQPRGPRAGALRLLTVAMMRAGDKLASYRILASALAQLPGDWTLDIAGDGSARGEVEALFRDFGDRVHFHGLVADNRALARLYAGSDLLVWPAVNEAFGMVFLEAASQGCPTVAGCYGGVAGVVAEGTGGLLAAPGDAGDFARCIGRVMAEPGLAERLSAGARANLDRRHTLAAAASVLRSVLAPLIATEALRA
ncbi:glycosyltransferase family 4 protein [Mangrovicella endophytica]|uniref:glycosyltransferase family 4 protein n=1 Tax=Mangrovicella endophytica TaxID=2066697 RepID=UPI000C9E9408|nr:glycosyltransferase family 4 protein [Mangrovicella endophytica]